jgi:hypothetical protein
MEAKHIGYQVTMFRFSMSICGYLQSTFPLVLSCLMGYLRFQPLAAPAAAHPSFLWLFLCEPHHGTTIERHPRSVVCRLLRRWDVRIIFRLERKCLTDAFLPDEVYSE